MAAINPASIPSGPVYLPHGEVSSKGAAEVAALTALGHQQQQVQSQASTPPRSTDGAAAEGSAAGASKSEEEQAGKNLDEEEGMQQKKPLRGWRERMTQVVSHEEASYPLAWQAFLTGMVDALIYSRSQIWTGFQTGNMVQFSQNIAQFMLPGAERFPLLTLERAISILAFVLGSLVGSLGGRRWGDRVRGWQVTTALVQSVTLWGAAGILLSRPEAEQPSFRYWPGIIALTAFSMGMQSIAAQKLVSPSFATTVAFTATLSQIASDPYLFALTLSPLARHRAAAAGLSKKPATLGRDRRLLAIFALCTGAGVAEMLLFSRAGLRGAMAIAAGFKLVLALLWLLPTGERPPPALKAA